MDSQSCPRLTSLRNIHCQWRLDEDSSREDGVVLPCSTASYLSISVKIRPQSLMSSLVLSWLDCGDATQCQRLIVFFYHSSSQWLTLPPNSSFRYRSSITSVLNLLSCNGIISIQFYFWLKYYSPKGVGRSRRYCTRGEVGASSCIFPQCQKSV